MLCDCPRYYLVLPETKSVTECDLIPRQVILKKIPSYKALQYLGTGLLVGCTGI